MDGGDDACEALCLFGARHVATLWGFVALCSTGEGVVVFGRENLSVCHFLVFDTVATALKVIRAAELPKVTGITPDQVQSWWNVHIAGRAVVLFD